MVNHDDRMAGLQEKIQARKQAFDVLQMQSAAGFVEQKQCAADSRECRSFAIPGGGVTVFERNPGQQRGDPQTLCFSTGHCTERLPQSQITKPHLTNRVQALLNLVMTIKERESIVTGHAKNFMHGTIPVSNLQNV